MAEKRGKRGRISSTVLPTELFQLPKREHDLLTDFLASLDVRSTSKATYYRSLLQFFLYLTDRQLRLDALTRTEIVQYKRYLLEQVEQQTFSLLTADNYLNAVRRFFGWMTDNDCLPNLQKNITNGISINANYEGFKKEPLMAGQVQLLLETLEKATLDPPSEIRKLNALRDYAFVFLMVSSGVRTITLTRMNVEDMQFMHGIPVIFVQRKGRDTKDDFVILEALPHKVIFDYLKARFDTEYLENLSETQRKEPLFVGHSNRNNGQRLTPDRLRQVIKYYLRRIGLNADVFSAHSLRHTYGSLQLALTGDIFQVAENMGHKDLKSTKRYTAKERQRQRLKNYQNVSHLFKKK